MGLLSNIQYQTSKDWFPHLSSSSCFSISKKCFLVLHNLSAEAECKVLNGAFPYWVLSFPWGTVCGLSDRNISFIAEGQDCECLKGRGFFVTLGVRRPQTGTGKDHGQLKEITRSWLWTSCGENWIWSNFLRGWQRYRCRLRYKNIA